MMVDNQVCIISYNSHGFNGCKRDFIGRIPLLAGCDAIIFNQENFLLKNNGYMARNALPQHHLIIKPAIKNGLEGRPKNGMFIAVPSILKDAAKEITVSSERLQCVIVELNSWKMLLVNSYFPTDPRADFDENELLILFAEIEKVIEECEFDRVVLGGDFNADFKRSSKFVAMVTDFVDKLELERSWGQFPADFTHTTEKEGNTYTSLIDHFFWDNRFSELVVDAGVMHVPENMSDHSPIFCKIQTSLISKTKEKKTECPKHIVPAWRNATEEQKENYTMLLNRKLEKINLSIECLDCQDVHCNAPHHISTLDDIMAQVLGSIEDVAQETLVTSVQKPKGKMKLPKWKEDVDPVKDTAHFWNAVWKSAGKPLNCQLHTIMKRTRNKYHLEIRKKKRLLERIKHDNMLNLCLNKDIDIFKEMRKQRACGKTCATLIDGRSNDIPDYLAGKYEQLYNQVDDRENLEALESELNMKINHESLRFVDMITPEVVKKAILNKLKPAKTDPVADISSDFLIHAPEKLFELIARCFKGYIIHARVSSFLLISTMVPLIKDKLGDITSSNNYRSIAISSVVLKVFDIVIISLFSDYLNLDDLQFSYQSGVSTSMCTWAAVETISYFLRNGNEVYTCLMDMSKAFDCVQHSHLFNKLLEQGMPAIVVRYILTTYKYQKANVKWNGEESRYFTIGNGVKQGAILSAILYCMYTNGLFEELRRSNIGCCVGRNYVGVLGYADDLYLLSPSIDGLQEMLKICEKYAENHNLQFSTDERPSKSKTKCMAYLRKDRELRKLKLCGNELPWVANGKHLGMRIDSLKENILTKDVLEKRARYIQSNNELMQEFAYTSCNTKAFINRTFNSHAYGSILWDLYGREARMLYNTWSSSIRKMYRLDRKTHRYFIEPVSEMEHLRSSIMKRFIKFTEKLEQSPKVVVRNMYKILGSDCRSTTGANTRNISLEFNADPIKGPSRDNITAFATIPEGEEWKINLVKEIIQIRDGAINSTGWTSNELDNVMTYLCTS